MADVDVKPLPKLSPQQLEEVRDAILDGFDDASLANALRFKWGLVLGRYVNLKQGFMYVVGDLLTWTEQRGKTRELVALAVSEVPGNPTVRDVAQSLGLSIPAVVDKYDLAKPPPAKPALEAMVVAQSRFVDFDTFLNRFRSLGNRVCRVETPVALGTGFLVGADTVLTNFHVIEKIEGRAEASETICRFDYHGPNGAGSGPREAKTVRLAADWLLAKSPYSNSDFTGEGEAGPNELDYALVRLGEPVGNAPGWWGPEPRGWFDLKANRPLLALRDFAVVPQHPAGGALKVAWGGVLGFNGSGNRVRYDTRTEAGSSGSPCFTVELEIFGLHHATAPEKQPKFNQAIPLDLICKDLTEKKVV
jgi:Trypsin-like peptidase domain/Effector-associated domain 1